MRKLINPRGRVVEVDEKDVPDLLRRGFLHIPPDEERMTYSQVHDHGPDYEDPYIPPSNTFRRELPAVGDTLDVDIV
jgi:hypothetical protein